MQRLCAVCSTPFEAQRPQAKYCSATCRVRNSRGGGIANQPPPEPPSDGQPTEGLTDAVRKALESAERVNTIAGQHALELARRIVSAPGMNTGVAALSKQLQAVLAEALQNSSNVVDPVDELRARRDAKRSAAAG